MRNSIDRLVSAGFLLPIDAEQALNKDLNYVQRKNLLPEK
jgi:hypothetical protein